MDRPPYAVPTMAEIAALPRNGLRVASTFSGCGGSCLGFEMAGYTVVWASEFIPAAAEVYRANHPGVPLDTRDIRDVRPEEILAAAGLSVGELDVLEGSPPCASFSTAGKRADGWGKTKTYSDGSQRVDDLFFEYARLLRGLQPRVFVAENVSGLVKGVAKGYFKLILAELQSCGYTVEARLLDAQWLGVPQARQRIIFQGVRSDLGRAPSFPTPLGYRYSVRDAIPWLATVSGRTGPHFAERASEIDEPMNSIIASDPLHTRYEVEDRVVQGDQGNRIHAGLDYTDRPAPAVLGTEVRTMHIERRIGTKKGERSIDRPAPTVQTHGNRYTESELTVVEPTRRERIDAEDARRVREGMQLGPSVGREYDKLRQGETSDKYFSLFRASADEPSPTVTAVGGTWAASVAHPTERRKFTIAELRRICAFPDDFVLTGTYAQQWERLGRAVPPLMMRSVAQAILDAGILE